MQVTLPAATAAVTAASMAILPAAHAAAETMQLAVVSIDLAASVAPTHAQPGHQHTAPSGLVEHQLHTHHTTLHNFACNGSGLHKHVPATGSDHASPLAVLHQFCWLQGEPFIVQLGWAATAAVFSFSLALVVWGRSGL